MSATPMSRTPSALSPALVVGGYLAALLVPLIGVALGIVALKKYEGVGTNHGHWIIAASIASAFVGMLMMIAASSGA